MQGCEEVEAVVIRACSFQIQARVNTTISATLMLPFNMAYCIGTKELIVKDQIIDVNQIPGLVRLTRKLFKAYNIDRNQINSMTMSEGAEIFSGILKEVSKKCTNVMTNEQFDNEMREISGITSTDRVLWVFIPIDTIKFITCLEFTRMKQSVLKKLLCRPASSLCEPEGPLYDVIGERICCDRSPRSVKRLRNSYKYETHGNGEKVDEFFGDTNTSSSDSDSSRSDSASGSSSESPDENLADEDLEDEEEEDEDDGGDDIVGSYVGGSKKKSF
jgi:hypothetical protein